MLRATAIGAVLMTGAFGASALAADADEIVIGMTVSQTGALNVDSVAQMRGYEMWRDEVNAAGGIKAGDKHYKVRFVSYDDQSQGGRVQQLYTRLIVQDKAQFLFSPYSSGLTGTAAVITEQYGRIMVVTGGAEGKTYELGNKYLFQAITSADHYLTGAVDALHALAAHGLVEARVADELSESYYFLRTLEHRLQMIEDEQTHTVPRTAEGLAHVACFAGYDNARQQWCSALAQAAHHEPARPPLRARTATLDRERKPRVYGRRGRSRDGRDAREYGVQRPPPFGWRGARLASWPHSGDAQRESTRVADEAATGPSRRLGEHGRSRCRFRPV
jgi:hypothetical protein